MKTDPPERPRPARPERNALGAATAGLPLLGLGALSLDATTSINQPNGPGVEVAAAILATIALNALFVAGDTAYDLLRVAQLRSHEPTEPGAAAMEDIAEHKALYVGVCNLGSLTMRAWMMLLCLLPAQAVAAWAERTWGLNLGWTGVFLAAVALSIPVAALNLLVGELIPKSYAVAHPLRTALRLRRFVKAFATIFGLPSRLARGIAGFATRRFGASATFAVANQAEEEIKTLLESAEETGEIEEEEKEMLHSVFEFGDTVAREVMTPRVDLDALPVTGNLDQVIHLIEESGHSRIPIYEGTDDQILGIVHAKDVLRAIARGTTEVPLRQIMHPALFVPENKPLHDLLDEMRATRSQMVIVQDEFGGTAGVVTIEDVVEELVGEIVDEYDSEEPEIVQHGDGFLIGGKANLDDVNDEVGSCIESDEFDTIGGYVFGLFGRQPRKGDSIVSDGYRFTVDDTDGRRILRLFVEPENDSQPGPAPDQSEATA